MPKRLPQAVQVAPGIVVDPQIRFGQPVIKGTRVPVAVLLDELAGGSEVRDVALEYGITARMCARPFATRPDSSLVKTAGGCAVIRFLVAGDLPRSVAPALRSRGYEAVDVRDVEMAAASDLRVFRCAVTHRCTLVSGDRGFASILRFPLGTHHGLVVARFAPHTPAPKKSGFSCAGFQFGRR